VIRQFNFKHWHLFLLLATVSCDNRKIAYSGFNDLVFGIESFILYQDNTFYIEMGAGGVEGNYQIISDTVRLKYCDKPGGNWPDLMLIRKDYFISIDSTLKIKRNK
jgi:hypothetical protein